MESKPPSRLATEPIGVAAAVVGIIEWALHEYVPSMPPGVVIAVGAIAVWLMARPWTVSHAQHVCEVEKARVETPPAMAGRAKKRGTAATLAVLVVMLAGAGTEAQGIRDRLEGIGRAALAGAAEEGLSQVEEVVGGEPAQPAQPAMQAPAPVPVTADPDVIEVTRGMLVSAGIIGFLCLLVIALYYRQGRLPPKPPSNSILGDPDGAKPTGPDPMETYRLDAIKRLFVITFAASILVQTLEVAAEAYYPGLHTTLNVAHVFLLALSALWATVWTMFGPFDRHVLPRVRWYELLTGVTYGTPPAGWKPMHVAVRCTVIGAIFYVIGQLLVIVAMNPG